MKRVLFLCVCLVGTIPGRADAHGPAFGYSTTTLGSGNSSLETFAMWRGGVAMVGPRFSYGVTENFQFSVSAPFHVNHGEHPVGRFTAMMPGEPQAEALVAWRFHHTLTGVGTRNESTLYLGVSGPTQSLPRLDGPPLTGQPAYYAAAATGHISRGYYLWAGGGYQHYGHWGDSEDHQSDSLLTSAVVGWRPHSLNKDYPGPTYGFSGRQPASGQVWRVVEDRQRRHRWVVAMATLRAFTTLRRTPTTMSFYQILAEEEFFPAQPVCSPSAISAFKVE